MLTASMAGVSGAPNMPAYSASKSAEIGLAKSAAKDLEVVARQMLETIPMRRYGAPSEVADVVCFLAGERSSYLTGLNVEIAGGSV